MAKYVKCIDNDKYTGCITNGVSYKVLEYNLNREEYLIIDDYQKERWLVAERFEDSYITFTSQEEFENAVMEVIMKRLSIHSHEAYIQVGDFGE